MVFCVMKIRVFLGQLYRFTNNPEEYKNGVQIFDRVMEFALMQYFKDSAVSASYK